MRGCILDIIGFKSIMVGGGGWLGGCIANIRTISSLISEMELS